MKIAEILGEIEEALLRLNLKDFLGTPLPAPVVASAVSIFHDGKWEKLSDALLDGSLSPEEYRTQTFALIDEYHQNLFIKRVERTLANVVLDQRELS